MSWTDRGKAFVTWVAVVGLFALTLWSLWLNRSATAAVAGALMIAIGLAKHLPIIESFEVFTLKAKFARQVSEADSLIKDIRALAEVSARMMYYQVGKGDRMTSMSWEEKRQKLAELDALLSSLSVPSEKIAELKAPFVHTVSLDLFRVLEHAADHRMRRLNLNAHDAIAKLPKPIPAGDPELARLVQQTQTLSLPFRTTKDVMADGRLDDMRAITGQLLDAPFPAEDRAKLETVRADVIRLDRACRDAGTITLEAERYLLENRDTGALATKLFGG